MGLFNDRYTLQIQDHYILLAVTYRQKKLQMQRITALKGLRYLQEK